MISYTAHCSHITDKWSSHFAIPCCKSNLCIYNSQRAAEQNEEDIGKEIRQLLYLQNELSNLRNQRSTYDKIGKLQDLQNQINQIKEGHGLVKYEIHECNIELLETLPSVLIEKGHSKPSQHRTVYDVSKNKTWHLFHNDLFTKATVSCFAMVQHNKHLAIDVFLRLQDLKFVIMLTCRMVVEQSQSFYSKKKTL